VGQHHKKHKESDIMADYSMEDSKWNDRKATVGAWFEANPDLAKEEDREALANGFFRIGDNYPENRMKYWTSITSLFAGLSNSPLGPGRASNLTVAQKSQLDLYISEYEEDAVAQYESNPKLRATARQHGKSGGMFYHLMENGAQEYAKSEAKAERAFLIKAFNSAHKGDNEAMYLWPTIPSEDGESQILDFNADGSPNVTYVAIQEEE
tara:strand:- start:671 stop:1297 length:627 start_codon:yes stop_codon:yes gene_type:complete